MPNFTPLKNYTLRLIDSMITAHGLQGPFLDAGCGRGDVARHLAQRGWEGLAVDFSPEAIQIAQDMLRDYPIQTQTVDIMDVSGNFRTIISSTVIEHVQDDAALLRHFHRLLTNSTYNGGWLIISMPTNPDREWRWDDNFYGHYRRYTKEQVEQLLKECGFQMLEFCDYTFPVFWAMRRAYTRLFPAKKPSSAVPEKNTAESSMKSAWNMGILSRFVEILPVWSVVYSLQKPFRHGKRGFEAVAIAQAL